MPGSDVMVSRLQAELEEKRTFQESLVGAALEQGRDLNDHEMELHTRAAERMTEIQKQLGPLMDSVRIANESRARFSELQGSLSMARGAAQTPAVEYRSAGHYVADWYYAMRGDEEAKQRVAVFEQRAAAHQTTTDNPGLLPETIVAPVINRVDASRPVVSRLNPTDLGQGSWAYAKVTQGTSVAVQSAEKAELASQKMTITKTSITPATYGGYVNVSKQDIQRTSPQILDMVIDDLAKRYAIVTENVCVDALYAGATAGTNTAVPAGTAADDITAAVWHVAGQVFSGMQAPPNGAFIVISVNMLATFGAAFGPAVPFDGAAPGSGFSIANFGSGAIGQISGIPVVVSAGMNDTRAMMVHPDAVRVYEHRYGALQVNEPSVWGVQVGYAGDFITVITDALGVVTIDTVA